MIFRINTSVKCPSLVMLQWNIACAKFSKSIGCTSNSSKIDPSLTGSHLIWSEVNPNCPKPIGSERKFTRKELFEKMWIYIFLLENLHSNNCILSVIYNKRKFILLSILLQNIWQKVYFTFRKPKTNHFILDIRWCFCSAIPFQFFLKQYQKFYIQQKTVCIFGIIYFFWKKVR